MRGWSAIDASSRSDSIASKTSSAKKKKGTRDMAATGSATTKVTLPTDLEIHITREFDAPREVVYKAMTDPKLIPQWWGPRRSTTSVDKMEVRPGGSWRFVNRSAD